jgi:hypothetical protein
MDIQKHPEACYYTLQDVSKKIHDFIVLLENNQAE